MEFLKEFLGDDLYTQVEAKLKGNDKVKLANLASGESYQNLSTTMKSKPRILKSQSYPTLSKNSMVWM